jgi:hypothetical protein
MLMCAWDGAMGNAHEEFWSEYLDGDYLADFDEYVRWHNSVTYPLSVPYLMTLSINKGKTEEHKDKPFPVPLCPRKNIHILSSDQSLASTAATYKDSL